MIATTFNLDEKGFYRLRDASLLLGVSMSYLLRIMLYNLCRSRAKKVKSFSQIQYHHKQPDVKWKLFHLRLSPQLYEQSLDSRKLFKCSVSCMLSMEIEENLEEIVRKLAHKTFVDNYSETYSIFYQSGIFGYNYQVYTTTPETNSPADCT